jgi:CheY-like chemotaxis protein
LQKIKEDPLLKKIPVIMLTTSSSEQDINTAYENHCNSYVKKPLDIGEFLTTIVKIEEFYLQLITLPK